MKKKQNMTAKLIVYKYSPFNGLYSGFEEAIPHPVTGEFQLPFYTTKLVPPDKRVGFNIIFKEKEGTLPGQGLGTWELVKKVDTTYYHKETKESVVFNNLDDVDTNIYTPKSPEENEYGLPFIKDIFIFNNETDEWEIPVDKLKNYLISLLKKSRNKIISQKIEYRNILFDIDPKSRVNITDYALRFSVGINETELFGEAFKLELDTLKNINMIPWIDANNETQLISPNTIIGLNYMIGFKELLVYNIYNFIRTSIASANTIEELFTTLPNMIEDLKLDYIHEFERLKFTEKFILENVSRLAEEILKSIPMEEAPKKEIGSEEVIEETPKEPVKDMDINGREPIYDAKGNIVDYI